MNYATICSGIEACSVAWHPLGWTPVFFAEVAAFQSALLKHYYPEVPNVGDFTTADYSGFPRLDVLCGGTPCQDFSVAGKRGGIREPRGNLALEFFALVDRLRPTWFIWENVPGVHSSKSAPADQDDTDDDAFGDPRDFQVVLSAIQECRYGACWRILDAQFFGVPQRRRRVFVVGHIGGWRSAAAVLFDQQGMPGNSASGRSAREEVARTLGGGSRARGWRGDLDSEEYTVAPGLTTGESSRYPDGMNGQIVSTLKCDGRRADLGVPMIAHSLSSAGADASEDGTGWGSPLVCDMRNITSAANRSNPKPGDPCHTLATGGDAIVIRTANTGANGHGVSIDVTPTLDGTQGPCVIPALTPGAHPGGFNGQDVSSLVSPGAPRRLTPLEWEGCFGFPDNYTLIPWRGKPAADAPRYQSLGNSMAVPVMEWLGRRIAMVERLTRAAA